MVSKQWFVKMEPLAKPADRSASENGEVRFVPERFDKNYMIIGWRISSDWCISRQLWWGHRIPAWYCDDCGEIIVSRRRRRPSAPSAAARICIRTRTLWIPGSLPRCGPSLRSAGRTRREDLEYFYPTSVLVTGYDIIFFWVARMIFSGIEHMGKPPFNTVLIHGLVRDAQGRKMSKSLGNGVDPLEIIDQYGADALRFYAGHGRQPGKRHAFLRRTRSSASAQLCQQDLECRAVLC